MSEVSLRVYKKFSKTDDLADYFLLDVDNSLTNFKLDLSVSENQDLGAVYGIGSQAFSLPHTKKNAEFFEYAEEVGSLGGGVAFSTIFDAQIMIDGLRVASGKLWFNNVVNNVQSINYQCTFTDSIPALNTLFENVKIGDLDWTAYDMPYSLATIFSSWDNSGAFPLDGAIKFPNAFYGYEDGDVFEYEFGVATPTEGTIRDSDTPLPIDNFKPAIRIRDVFDKIFENQAISYSSSFLEGDTTFGTTAKTMEDVYMLPSANDARGAFDIIPTKVVVESSPANVTYNSGVNTYNSLDDFSTELLDTSGQWNALTGIFTATDTGTFNIAIEALYSNMVFTATDSANSLYLKITKNAGQDLILQQLIPNEWAGTPSSQTWSGALSVDLQALDYLQISIGRIFPPGEGTGATAVTGTIGINMEIEGAANTAQNSVFMEEQFGDMSVLDFIAGVSHMFNLVMWSEFDAPNVIRFEPYNDYIDLGTSLDWTDRVDKSMGVELYHPAHEQNKRVDLGYKKGQDFSNIYVQERYNGNDRGYYQYATTNDYSQGTRDNLNRLFAPTSMKPIKGGNAVWEAQRMTIPHIAKKSSDSQSPFNFAPRILFDNGVQTLESNTGVAYDYWLRDYVGTLLTAKNTYLQMSPFTSMVGGTDNFYLGWTSNDYWHDSNSIYEYNSGGVQNLFNEFYARQYNQLYRQGARKMVCNIKFDPLDITTFKLNDEILIDGQAWLINKISGFNLLKTDSIKVEFIKALQPINQPVFTIGTGDGNPNPPDEAFPVGFSDGGEVIILPDTSNPSQYAVKCVSFEDNSIIISSSAVPAIVTRQLGIVNGSGSLQLYNNYTIGRVGQQAESGTPLMYGDSNIDNETPPTALVEGQDNIIPLTSRNLVVLGDNNNTGNDTKNNSFIGDDNTLASGNGNNLIVGDDNIVGITNNSLGIFGNNNTIGRDGGKNAVFGDINIIGNNSDNLAIYGSNNNIGDTTDTVAILGNSNIIGTGVANSSVFGGGNNVGNSCIAVGIYGPSNTLGTGNIKVMVLGSGNTLGTTNKASLIIGNNYTIGNGNENSILEGVGTATTVFDRSIIYGNSTTSIEGTATDNSIILVNEDCAFGQSAALTNQLLVANNNISQSYHQDGVMLGCSGNAFKIWDSTSTTQENKNYIGTILPTNFDVNKIDTVGTNTNNVIGQIGFSTNDWAPSSTALFDNTTFIGKSHHTGGRFTNYKKYVFAPSDTITLNEDANVLIMDWSGGTGLVTINLPAATTVDGQILDFKSKISSPTGRTILIAANGTDAIDGAATFSINTLYQYVKMISMDGDWWILAKT